MSFTAEEQHALCLGLYEMLCPFKPRYPMNLDFAEYTTKREYHYYLGGRALGLPFFLIEAAGLVKLFSLIF